MVSRRKFDREALEAHMLCGVGEVPLYEPTEKEFEQGPYAYLRTIRAEAQKYGLCRIRYARGASGGGGGGMQPPAPRRKACVTVARAAHNNTVYSTRACARSPRPA